MAETFTTPTTGSQKKPNLNANATKELNPRIKKFIDFLEQIPRLCSPTICGTLSQPTTSKEKDRSNKAFEWSLEQKAILSPVNITVDSSNTEEWQNVAELDVAWRQTESEIFFSQQTIAPSPVVQTGLNFSKISPLINQSTKFMSVAEEDEEEDDIMESFKHYDEKDMSINNMTTSMYDFTTSKQNIKHIKDDSEYQDDDKEFDLKHNSLNFTDDNDQSNDENKQKMDDREDCFAFSPQVTSSQQNLRLTITSPQTLENVFNNPLLNQSTPKTNTRSQRRYQRMRRIDGM